MISTRREATFDPTTAAVRDARRFVGDTVGDGLPSEVVERAVLITSELTTNVVLHARTAFTVVVEVYDDHVRLGVRDTSDATPVLRAIDRARVTGRGLAIVDAISQSWGIDTMVDGAGKWVWARIDAQPGAQPAR
jgi:anti-sigma regulatory factor (Ser/Thr protein kinase)